MKVVAIAWGALSLLLAGTAIAAPAAEIPRLVTDAGGTTRLLVDGKPFIALGGELGNSNASHLAVAKPLFAKLAAMKLNTVLVPVSWELVEPAEGKWSFGLVGDSDTRGAPEQAARRVALVRKLEERDVQLRARLGQDEPGTVPARRGQGRPPRRGAVGVRAREHARGRARVHGADALRAHGRRPRPHRDHGAGRERGRDDRRVRRPQRGGAGGVRGAGAEAAARALPGQEARDLGAGVRRAAWRPRSCSWRGTTPSTSRRSPAPARSRTRCRC